jgi:hypothetical protein
VLTQQYQVLNLIFKKKIDFKKVRLIREQTSRSGYFGWGVSLLSSVKDTKRSAF